MVSQSESKTSSGFNLSFGGRLLLGLILVNLFVYGLAWQNLQESRAHHLEQARIDAINISNVLAQNIKDAIDKIDISLLALRDVMDRQLRQGGIDAAMLNKCVQAKYSRLQGLDGIRITNAAGWVRYGTKVGQGPPVNIAFQAQFKYLRDHPDAGAIISPPTFGKISKEWTLKVVRRYNDPQGRFAGLISGIIELKHFAQLFEAVDVGPKGVVVLRDGQLAMIVRSPNPKGIGSTIGLTNFPESFRLAVAAQPESGTLSVTSAYDDVHRTIAYHKVGPWPLLVHVGLATDDYLADWYDEARIAGAVAIIFTIVTALLSWLLYQDWRQRQRLMRELGESRETFRAFAEMASDWFWEQDDAGRLTRVSRGFAVLSGVPVEECIGKTPWELVFALTGKNGEIFERLFQQRAAFEDVEWAFVNRQGKKRSVIINGEPVRDRQGAFAGFRGTGKDMTERKRLEDELIKMAKTDELTGLVNRRHFMELAKNEHRRALRLRQPLALAAIDIDRFKHINDSLGHAAGDQVLQTLATVFLKNIRAIDVFARLGGDEFVLLLPGAHMAQAVEIIERVRRALADAPMQLADQAVSVTISVGVASLAGDDTRFESLMHRADQALYASKEGGRNRVTADEAGMKVVPSESP